MSSLSNELLSVLEALPASTKESVGSRYRELVSRSAGKLDEIEASADNVSPVRRATEAATAFKVLLGANVVTPESAAYDAVKKANWSTTCWLPAACIVKAQNAVEVALALKVVIFTGSIFAVRNQGHNANSGLASVGESGVLLDVTGLNEVSLSPAKDTVSVGAGANWGAVYEKLEEHELTTVGGRANEVGVGGLILQGGMSHFPNYWGMACDNVKNFEIVLANSKIKQANATENPDLFRALKGGSTNLGIATRFELFTHAEHRVWCTLKVYNASDSERVLAAAIEIQRRMEEDDRIAFFLTIQAKILIAGMLYRGEEPAASVFDAFDSIEPLTVPMPGTLSTQFLLAKTLSSGIHGQMKREIGTATVRPDIDLYVELHRILQAIEVPDSVILQFTYQPLGKGTVKVGEDRGGNLLGLQPESQAFLGMVAQWTDEKADEQATAAIRRLISDVDSSAKARGALLNPYFLNDAAASQPGLSSYTPENLAHLHAASQKWDSEGVFQKLQNSGFLLRDVKAGSNS